MLVTAAPALAEPADVPADLVTQAASILDQQADSYPSLVAAQNDLDALEHELEKVIEKHNGNRVEIDRLTTELKDSQARLEILRAEQIVQQQLLEERLKTMYKTGQVNFMNVLFSSSSLTDLYQQSLYMAKITSENAKMEKQIRERADELALLTDEIDQKRTRQVQAQNELEEYRKQIEARIVEIQGFLTPQVKALLAQQVEPDYLAMLGDLQIADEVQAQVVQTALQYLGVPYVWGGESPSGFDCSGLTKYVFAQHGVDLPHFAASQYNMGVPVPVTDLQPGDLLFWGPGEPYHVGMYIGQSKYIHAPTFGDVVKISMLQLGGDYAGARRFPLQPKTS